MAKTQNQTTVSSSKASKNTPVASFASYVAKVTDSKKANALKEVHAREQAKKAQAQTTKKGVFSLVAGTVAAIEHKALKKAITYHINKGNLVRTPEGIKLTAQGATLWNAERVAPNADQFQKIAVFVNGGANLPEFGGEKKTPVKIGNKQLPSLEFWGGFVTSNMRLCFAALWSTK